MSNRSDSSAPHGAEDEGGKESSRAKTSGPAKTDEDGGDHLADTERTARVQQDATIARSRAEAEAAGKGPDEPQDGLNPDG